MGNLKEKVLEKPTTSCHHLSTFSRPTMCLAACLNSFAVLHAVGWDKKSLSCVCCPSPLRDTEASMPGDWQTYVGGTCLPGYELVAPRICLKYNSTSVNYTVADALCKADGGFLIRIDSAEKNSLFINFIENHVDDTSGTQVWVQATKNGSSWYFDDNTRIDFENFGDGANSNGPNEKWARARGALAFQWQDGQDSDEFSVVCESKTMLYWT
ncbi:uncharacterized protein LOC133188480 [Saccostrea echinata]|uniref:uncharacterized protein LOC133188480 n=1 Tax=Saccostrea echinata TaxID=191078 RepID=UPI002A83EDF5|nr:uncharacterized protein LOC133188480 [Saccostrea echinata]